MPALIERKACEVNPVLFSVVGISRISPKCSISLSSETERRRPDSAVILLTFDKSVVFAGRLWLQETLKRSLL